MSIVATAQVCGHGFNSQMQLRNESIVSSKQLPLYIWFFKIFNKYYKIKPNSIKQILYVRNLSIKIVNEYFKKNIQRYNKNKFIFFTFHLRIFMLNNSSHDKTVSNFSHICELALQFFLISTFSGSFRFRVLFTQECLEQNGFQRRVVAKLYSRVK